MAGEEQVLAWMSNFVILVLLAIGLIATNLFWGVHWWWWVPQIARKFTWLKRHKRSITLIADDAGWMNFDFPEEILPEGVYRMKDDNWHFLPRQRFANPDGTQYSMNEIAAQQIIQRRFILKEMGVPIWIGYAGRLPLVNPMALAVASVQPMASLKLELETILEVHETELMNLFVKPAPSQEEQSKLVYGVLASLKVELSHTISRAPPPEKIEVPKVINCGNVLNYVKTLPGDFQPPLLKFIDGLSSGGLNGDPTPITYIDNSDIKKLIPRAYTPTQVKAVAKNRERYGELKANKSLWEKAMPIALILGLGIILIIVFAIAFQWFQPREAAHSIIVHGKDALGLFQHRLQ